MKSKDQSSFFLIIFIRVFEKDSFPKVIILIKKLAIFWWFFYFGQIDKKNYTINTYLFLSKKIIPILSTKKTFPTALIVYIRPSKFEKWLWHLNSRADRQNNFNFWILATLGKKNLVFLFKTPLSSRCELIAIVKPLICLLSADYQLGALFIPNNRYERYFLLVPPCRGNLLLFVVVLVVFSARNRPDPIAIKASQTCVLSVI